MEMSVEKIKLLIKPIDENGKVVKRSGKGFTLEIGKVEHVDDSLVFRFAATHSSGRPIPVQWNGEGIEVHWYGEPGFDTV
jgi:hypothetical protein